MGQLVVHINIIYFQFGHMTKDGSCLFSPQKNLYEQHLKSSLSSLREINSIKLIYYLHFVLNIYRQFIHSFL